MDRNRIKNAQKVVVAMSGGLDSSVTAALLKRDGFNIVGVFMKFWPAPHHFDETSEGRIKSLKNGISNYKLTPGQSGGGWNRCCFSEAETRARKVAKILKIPFYVFNFEKEFKKRIVDYFLEEYKTGKTANPCVVCNKEIKFGLLLEKALALNADYVATGHYARLRREIPNSKFQIPNYKYKLLRGKDKNKDQSYFLWQLNQKQLKHIMFPLGDYTKDKVRALAKKFKLPILGISESMEICFIQTTVNDFLARHIKSKPGPILTTEGKKIGKHQGLLFYTIGQRKGIGLPGGPFYVATKNLKSNTLIVARFFNDKNLYSKSLIAKNVNWVPGQEPQLPLKIKAQIRYRHKPALATITKTPEGKPPASYGAGLKPKAYTLKFTIPQRAITAGQSVVFYKGQEILGGGIIC